MKRRRGRLAKLASLPVLAVCGFAIAATLAGASLAGDITSTSTSTTTTSTSTTTTTTTPTGGEGCTPGFWKTHVSAWAATGFSPGQTVGSVFSAAPASVASLTLLQGVSLNGGGVNALTRHAIAAILAAAHPSVDYPLTVTEVVNAVNAAFASGDAATIESLKDTLDEFNNQDAAGFCD